MTNGVFLFVIGNCSLVICHCRAQNRQSSKHFLSFPDFPDVPNRVSALDDPSSCVVSSPHHCIKWYRVMRCPKCGCQDDKVIDSRSSREGATIRRRRECVSCGHRFTTYEVMEQGRLMVLKRDDRREEFSREKLLAGVQKACQKRPVSQEAIENLVQEIVDDLSNTYDREVPCKAIGERVMAGLRALDPVAVVRDSSV